MEYYVKIINGEKLKTNLDNFNKWLYKTGDDFIVCFGDAGTPLYIHKDKILLGFKREVKNETDKEK